MLPHEVCTGGLHPRPECPALQVLCPDLCLCEVAEGPEEVLSSAPAVESGSEEPPRAELQKEAEGCHLVPNGASCPKIHSRRFRE